MEVKNRLFFIKRFYQFLLTSGIIFLTYQVSATNYYLSTSGNDTNSGTSESLPWQSLAKINSFIPNPGDQILLKRGDEWTGSLTVKASGIAGNPITFGTYGTGANPIISGFTKITSWTNLGSNIWESTSAVSTLTTCNMVVINGVNTAMGRYPNADEANGGYLTYQSHSGYTSLTSNSLTGTPNWTGGEVVFRSKNWSVERALISSQSSTTITFPATPRSPSDGFGFFIQNDNRTLDQQDEWYFNPTTKKLRIYSLFSPTNIKVASVNVLVVPNGNYLTFSNITFQGANQYAIYNNLPNNNLTIQDCSILYTGIDAIKLAYTSYANISGCNISDTNNIGINLYDSDNYATISSNVILNTGILIGMGISGYSTCTGISSALVTNGITCEYNRIINTGYIAINFTGSNVLVKNNFIDTYCTELQDGGGIYTHQSIYSNRVVSGNIIQNGIGNFYGTNITDLLVHGIFIDDGGANVTIRDNTITNIGSTGLYFQATHDIAIFGNTIFNVRGLGFFDGAISFQGSLASPTINFAMKKNIIVAKEKGKYCLFFYNVNSDASAIKNFGIADSNYYARPIDDSNVFKIRTTTNPYPGTTFNLNEWKTFSGQDAHSQNSPQSIASESEFQFEYNATKTARTVSLSSPMIDMKGTKYATSITLPPYTSAVLIKDATSIATDVTKPSVTAFTISATSSSLVVPVSSFTATDNKAVTGFKLTESATAPNAGDAGWNAVAPTSYAFTTEGTKTLYAWAKDAASNVSSSASAQVVITLPSTTTNTLGYTDVYTSSVSTALFSMPVTFSQTGEINSISIYHEGGTGNLILGVYSDQSGFPSSRLGLTATTIINSSAGWQTVSLTNPVLVNAGQTVWLSWLFQNPTNVRYTAGTPGRAASSNTWSTGMPAIFGTSNIANNKYSIYCSYIPNSSLDVTKPSVTAFTISATSSSLVVPVSSFTATDNKAVTGFKLTESATAPNAGDAGWNAVAPTSYAFTTEGTKTLYAWAKDAASNVSSSASAQVVITLPSTTTNTLGYTDVYTSSVSTALFSMPVTFSQTGEINSISIYHEGGTGNLILGVYSDQSGFPSSRLGLTATTIINSSAGWQTVSLTNPVLVNAGQTVWLSWLFQNPTNVRYTAGTPGRAASSNTWSTGMPAIFGTSNIANNKYSIYCSYIPNSSLDVTKPSVTAFTISATSSSLVVPVSSFTATDNKAVTGFKLTESATAPNAGDAGWNAVAPTSYAFTTEGTKTLYAWAKDAASNVSSSASAQVVITLPSTTTNTLGYTDVYTSSVSTALFSMPVTFSQTGEINSISIYHEGGTGNLILGVYSDQSGFPSSRLGLTATTIINSSAGWQTVSLTNPVLVNAGQTVWLSWLFQNPTNVRYTAGTPGRAASSNTWSTGMPAIFGTSNIANNKYSIYCSYIPNSSLDVTKPSVTAFTISATSSSLVVPVSSFTATDNKAVTGFKLTESATAPNAGDAGWNAVAPTSYAFTTEGTKTLYAWAKDAASNVSSSASAQVVITLPSTTTNTLGYTDVYTSSVSTALFSMPVTFSQTGEINSISIYHEGGTGNLILGVYSDQSGFPSSRLGLTATTIINSSAGWQTVSLTNPVLVNAGQTVWLSWLFQNPTNVRYTAGTPGRAASSNTWSTGMPAIFGTSNIANNKYSIYCSYIPNSSLDVTKPSVTAFTISATSSSLVVPVSSFTATDNKAVTGFKLTESATAPNAGDAGWNAVAPTSYAFTTEGTKTLYAWAKDAASNVSSSASAQVVITLPSTTTNTLGYTDVYTSSVSTALFSMPVTFSQTGEINSISIYHEGGTGNLILGVYSDQSGFPSSRLGLTATTIINSSAGWQTVSLTNPVLVNAGQTVWLSWLFQNPTNVRYTAGTPGRAASSNTWSTGMPAIFGTSNIANNKYSIYCSYTANATVLKDAFISVVTKVKSIQNLPFGSKNILANNYSLGSSAQIAELNEFKLYPNPAISFVNIDYLYLPEIGTRLILIDSNGRIIINQLVEFKSNRIDVSQLSIGIYFIKSINSQWNITRRLIIK